MFVNYVENIIGICNFLDYLGLSIGKLGYFINAGIANSLLLLCIVDGYAHIYAAAFLVDCISRMNW